MLGRVTMSGGRVGWWGVGLMPRIAPVRALMAWVGSAFAYDLYNGQDGWRVVFDRRWIVQFAPNN